MTKEEILAAIKEKVLSIVPDAKVMLFGSRVPSDWHEESDWDILVQLAVCIMDVIMQRWHYY
jgi:predicted nucleotidyltransferase